MTGREPRVRRAEAKEMTRRRLLSGALRLLDEGGEAALTVSAVSRRAGVAQSTFYVHFQDKDDLLQVLGDEVVLQARRSVREARRHLAELPDREALRQAFRVPLAAMASHPELFRLTLRARYEPASALGDAARQLRDDDRRDLVEDLAVLGLPHGTADERRRLEMVADGYAAITEALGLGHVEGRYPDLDEVLEVLVEFNRGLTAAVRRRSAPAGRRPPPASPTAVSPAPPSPTARPSRPAAAPADGPPRPYTASVPERHP